MNINEQWERAIANTEIIRPRIKPLSTFEDTKLSYLFLAESAVNYDTTVVRKGIIVAEKPALLLPPNMPQFEGFDLDEMNGHVDFLLLRGISFPSLKYNNKVKHLDIYDGKLSKAIKVYKNELQRHEDIKTGLIIGPEDCWQLSVLIFVCSMMSKSAENDIKRILEGMTK